jgi:hypothetical protein
VYIKRNVYLFVCLFSIKFHTFEPISTIFGMMVEGRPWVVLDTWKYAWGQIEANLFLHYFLFKEGIGIMTTNAGEKSWRYKRTEMKELFQFEDVGGR